MISVIICTYNPKYELLARVLKAIFNQSLQRNCYEVIIVDNNSDIPINEWLRLEEFNVKIIEEKKQGLLYARQAGFRESKFELLIYVDDDNVLDRNYLETAYNWFLNKNIGIASGSIRPDYQIDPPKWLKAFESSLAIKNFTFSGSYLTSIPKFNKYFPVGAGMVIRKSILYDYYNTIHDSKYYIPGRVGNQLSSGEDIDLVFFALYNNYLIGTIFDLKLTHIIPAARVNYLYMKKLIKSSLQSSYVLNEKWKIAFDLNILPVFDESICLLVLKYFYCLIFCFNFENRLRISIYNYLLKIKIEKYFIKY